MIRVYRTPDGGDSSAVLSPQPRAATGAAGAKAIVDYTFETIDLKNPDGSLYTIASNCTEVAGPGDTAMGKYQHALDFGTVGRVSVQLPADKVNFTKFCVRVAFLADAAVTGRQNLVESNLLPFSLFLDKTNGTNEFRVVATVATTSYGWSGTSTEYYMTLQTGKWYVADLVYDTDSLGLFIDGKLVSIHAFPNGKIQKFNGTDLFIGTWVDGARNHFPGQIAGLKFYNGIPEELEAILDEHRSDPEWFISYKYESIKGTLNFNDPVSKPYYDYYAQAYIQDFRNGLIMFVDSIGTAFEMHGAIWTFYKARNNNERQGLGYLISDEGNTTKPGGRKNLFRKGGIYWSPATGAIPVTGQIYMDYEQWNESAFIGFPTAAATSIPGGLEQKFQGARMYFKNGTTTAHEVHGAILTKLLNSGGVAKWGFPVSNEMDVKRNNNVIGKSSEFEGCTIYWSAATGAFEVHGDIRRKYKELNGPLSQLGFPTSDEQVIPGVSGAARYNTFQQGSILWFGSYNNMNVCYPFRLYLGRIDSKESEGAFMGQNDLYLRATINDNGHQIYSKRFPDSGDYGGHNVINVNKELGITIVPNDPNRIIKLTLDIWESDDGAPFGGGDDHLGVYNKTISISNAWGLKENNGVFNSGAFSKINSVTWSVKPQINENALSLTEKWWGVQNAGTPTLTYNQYAAAFRDVDSESEWWDVSDWLEKAFYELVVKGLANGGNCFGMSLEAIYAWKHRSLFSLPLNRFNTWSTVVNEFNIKHQYQVGASPIWWFVGQFLSGNTHDPVDVFNETRNEFARGNNPVTCISQNWDFGGKPHCVLPAGWDSSSKPWKMTILDPNFPGSTRTLFVDPDKNEFSYDGGNKYSGGEWSGGRFHYMPWTVLCERPRTPIWDAILLLLAGTVVILGSDSTTESLTDTNGTDLDLFGQDTIARQKQGKPVENKFFSVKGFDGKGTIASELYMRKEKQSSFHIVSEGIVAELNRSMSLNELATNKSVANIIKSITSNTSLSRELGNRSVNNIINDRNIVKKLSPEVIDSLKRITQMMPVEKDFNHKVKGINNGKFEYAVKNKLNEFMVHSAITKGESQSVGVKDLGTPSSVVSVKTTKNKAMSLEICNHLGAGKDKIKISISNIPAAASQDVQLNIKPGMSGLDIMAAAQSVKADITIETTIDGRKNKYQYDANLEGGMRIRPSSIFTDGELKVGKIDNLFGQISNVTHLKKK
jgi:hypothetical protein